MIMFNADVGKLFLTQISSDAVESVMLIEYIECFRKGKYLDFFIGWSLGSLLILAIFYNYQLMHNIVLKNVTILFFKPLHDITKPYVQNIYRK